MTIANTLPVILAFSHAVAQFPSDLNDYRLLTDPSVRIEDRHAAEDRLAQAPPSLLRMLFADLDAPVGGVPMTQAFLCPGMPGRHMELHGYPAVPQIVYARLRVWNHLSRNAEPADERRRVLASLFPLAESHTQKLSLLQSLSAQNWSPEIEDAVGAWLLDRSQPYDIRATAARSLVSRNHKEWRETVLQEAWRLRADSLEGAILIAGAATPISGDSRFPYDARSAILIADNFERVRQTQPTMSAASAATTLGNYLNVKFTPPLDSPIKWLSDEWHTAVVQNARRWVDANREALEAHAQRAAAGEKVENRFAQAGFVPSREEEAVRAKERNLRRVRELKNLD